MWTCSGLVGFFLISSGERVHDHSQLLLDSPCNRRGGAGCIAYLAANTVMSVYPDPGGSPGQLQLMNELLPEPFSSAEPTST